MNPKHTGKAANGCHNCKKFEAKKLVDGIRYTCDDDDTDEREQETHEIIESKLRNNVMHTCENHDRKTPEEIEADRSKAKEARQAEYERQMKQFREYVAGFCNTDYNGHRLGKGLYMTRENMLQLCANVLTAGGEIDANFFYNLKFNFDIKVANRLYRLMDKIRSSKEFEEFYNKLKPAESSVEIIEED